MVVRRRILENHRNPRDITKSPRRAGNKNGGIAEQQRAEILATNEPERRGVLGGLISRMTGSAAAEPVMREQPTMSQEPQFHGEYEEMDANDDQVEVPAFLRRQAN